ncbi:MAG: hypothetical protein IT462_10075 [Planctomycetes bacterium]|nr:hypothetical protein [Planctomycetota bacterium]
MNTQTRIAWLNRWLLLIFPSYVRYLAMLDRNRIWTDRFPLEARDVMKQLLDEQTHFCQRLADLIDYQGGHPEIAQFPEDAARLNFLEMAVAIKKTIERLEYNLAALESDRRDVNHVNDLAELLEEAIEMTRHHIHLLKPLSAEFSASHK